MVGFIALAGVATGTGVVMLVFIDTAWKDMQAKCRSEGRLPTTTELRTSVVYGAVERVRPVAITVVTTLAALGPPMWSTGRQRDHAPHRRTDVRRHGQLRHSHPDRDPGDVSAGAGATPGAR